MKAAVYHGQGDIRVEEVPTPVATEDNMIAKVLYCAICGTDLKTYTVGNPSVPAHQVIGHEMVGMLTHVGSYVRGYAPGDIVTLATTISCTSCAYCRLGLGNLCPNKTPVGSVFAGAFAEYIEIPRAAVVGGNAVRIESRKPLSWFALCEPLSCAINAFEIAGVTAGDSVAIIGGGPLGAIHAELAKAWGAKQVFIVDVSKERLALLGALSGVTLIDSQTQDVQALLKDATGGLGADRVMVCAPAAAAFETSLELVRKGGSVCFFASLPPAQAMLSLNSRTIHYNELRVVGCSDSRPEHVRKAVALISDGKIDCNALITHTLPLESIVDGFELMREKKSMKVLVCANGE